MQYSKIAAIAGAILASATLTSAYEGDSPPPGVYFAKERGQSVQPYGTIPSRIAPQRGDALRVQALLATRAQARLGSNWVPTAVRLGKLESSYRCGATGPRVRGGRARGVLQVMPGSARALGYDPSRLHECEYGIEAGLAHMKKCLDVGVRTHAQMSACHVAGWAGWNRRLAAKAERYKQQYIRMAGGQTPGVPWAGRLVMASR